MVEIRTDKEVIQIMGKCVDFVSELIDYIAEYPDDDYMTMECLCRKLHKHELIDKKDGYYLVDKGIKLADQTEPSGDWICDTCKYHTIERAVQCKICGDGGQYEPQTVLEMVLDRQTDEDRRKMAESVCKAIKDEPQTDCSWR